MTTILTFQTAVLVLSASDPGTSQVFEAPATLDWILGEAGTTQFIAPSVINTVNESAESGSPGGPNPRPPSSSVGKDNQNNPSASSEAYSPYSRSQTLSPENNLTSQSNSQSRVPNTSDYSPSTDSYNPGGVGIPPAADSSDLPSDQNNNLASTISTGNARTPTIMVSHTSSSIDINGIVVLEFEDSLGNGTSPNMTVSVSQKANTTRITMKTSKKP